MKINLPMPSQEIRYLIIKRELLGVEYINNTFIELMSYLTEDVNAAEIVRYCTNIKKNYVLYGNIIESNLLKPLIENIYKDKRIDKCRLCRMIKESLPEMKVDDISELTGIPSSSIYRYLKK